MPPLADEGGDVVVGDSGADCKGHSQCQSYRRKSAQIIGHARPNRSQTWAIGLCGVTGTDSYGCRGKFMRRRRS